MQTETYSRRPFDVNAVQVTPQNADEIALWCGGKAGVGSYKVMGQSVSLVTVMVPGNGPNKGKMIEAKIGSWVVELNGQFRVYREKQFREEFERVQTVFSELKLRPEDLVEVIDPKDPYYGFQGEVQFVEQTCITMPGAGGCMYNPFDLKRIDEYSDATMERIAEEARLEAMKPDPDSHEALEKINALRAAAEAEFKNGVVSNAEVRAQIHGDLEAPSPLKDFEIDSINGIKTGYVVRVKLEANAYFGQTGTVVGLGKDGVRILVAMHDKNEIPEAVAFQADEVEVIALDVPESIDSADFKQDDMVETLNSLTNTAGTKMPPGTTGRVTVTGIDSPVGESIEVLFSDGGYGCFRPDELKKIENNPFEVNDLVKVMDDGNGETGLVTAIDVEHEGENKIEVLFGRNTYVYVRPHQLVRVGARTPRVVKVINPISDQLGWIGTVVPDIDGEVVRVKFVQGDNVDDVFHSYMQNEVETYYAPDLKDVR